MNKAQAINKTFIFDLDDTLRLGVNARFLNAEEFVNQVPLPGVVNKLRDLKEQQANLFITSNQGSPSFAKTTELRIWKSVIYFNDNILGGVMSDIRLDFYHPEGNMKHRYLDKRKPKPDLILELVEDNKIDKKDLVYIGNAPSDELAASNAGVGFVWAHDFFEWDKRNLFLDERFGYQWDIDQLRGIYKSDTGLLTKLNRFIELSGENYRKQPKTLGQ